MSIMVGVISYLPNNELRTQRLTACRTQLDWLHKIYTNTEIFVVAQAYTSAECDCDYVTYLRYENGIGAGNARNVLLDKFYNSDYDWLFLADDDTLAYEYYSYENFLTEIANNEKKFAEIDAVSAVEPEYHAYKKLNFDDKSNLTHFKFEPRELNSGSATSVIRNIKKFYNKEIYYPNIDANKGEGREDIEFLIAWLLAGFNWYTMDTWIRKSLCFDKSSIFGSDTKARDKILMHDLDVICERYSDYGLSRGVNGKITWANFNKVHNKSKRLLYIKRDTPIEYDENTTPKEKQSNVKDLF